MTWFTTTAVCLAAAAEGYEDGNILRLLSGLTFYVLALFRISAPLTTATFYSFPAMHAVTFFFFIVFFLATFFFSSSFGSTVYKGLLLLFAADSYSLFFGMLAV